MSCGIYQICIGDYVYFGSSNNVDKRLRQHKQTLRDGKHKNPKMQSVYNKHKCFEGFMVEECNEDNRFDVEQIYIDTHWGLPELMNVSKDSRVPVWDEGLPDYMKESIRQAMIGKYHTEESKTKMSNAKKGKKKPVIQCPHCPMKGAAHVLKRYHFDNCKHK